MQRDCCRTVFASSPCAAASRWARCIRRSIGDFQLGPGRGGGGLRTPAATMPSAKSTTSSATGWMKPARCSMSTMSNCGAGSSTAGILTRDGFGRAYARGAPAPDGRCAGRSGAGRRRPGSASLATRGRATRGARRAQARVAARKGDPPMPGAPHPTRRNISSGAPWEPIVGYSRAVRIGDHIYLSGHDGDRCEGNIVGVGDRLRADAADPREYRAALKRAGATLDDVVRTRIFVTDIAQWEAVGRAHGEVFGKIRPACTMVRGGEADRAGAAGRDRGRRRRGGGRSVTRVRSSRQPPPLSPSPTFYARVAPRAWRCPGR